MDSKFFVIFFVFILLNKANSRPENFKTEETCENSFYCPIDTYCEARNIVKCPSPPCRPLFVCLPNLVKGCNSHEECPNGMECVGRTVPCIGKSCKKIAHCVKSGTCDALVCPPSHRCVSDPRPHCVRGILTISEVAKLSQQQ